jgi:hypothetical protein
VWSTTIRSDLGDYNEVLEQSTDKFLLVNVLEARDDAPLHFSTIPHIGGALQATASLTSSIPFEKSLEKDSSGTGTAATSAFMNGTVSPTITVQSSPTFEVDTVETKEFSTGLSSPIDPKFIKYWVDRGIDKRIILFLFFSSAEIVDHDFSPCRYAKAPKASLDLMDKDVLKHIDTRCEEMKPYSKGAGIFIGNNPRKAADGVISCLRELESSGSKDAKLCHSRTEFALYLKIVNAFTQNLTANAYTPRTVIAYEEESTFKDIAGIDPTKFVIEPRNDGKYNLYTAPASPSFAICLDGKIEVLTGERTSDATQPAATRPGITVVVKDKKGKTQKTSRPAASAPMRGNVCADSLINVSSAGIVGPSLPDPSDLVPPERPYLSAPCEGAEATVPTAESPDAKKAEQAPAPISPYCQLLLGFLNDPWNERYTILLRPRSAAEMIRFLGDVTYFQEALKKVSANWSDMPFNEPLTLDYDVGCHKNHNDAECVESDGGWLFNLVEGGQGRISVHYRNGDYSLPEHTPDDHSLEVLSIVNQQVNLNKSAADLRTTPTVQLVN